MEDDNTPPERGWFYRRWYTFISSLIVFVLLLTAVVNVDSDDVLKWIALSLIGWGIIKDTLYMAGASVIDYAKLAASWKGKKDE